MTVRVRFAPSPTGPLHIGGVRTALYNYIFAKQNKGTFILRIEDTDQGRYVEGAEEYIINSLKWCGINIDEGYSIGGEYGPYKQSERKKIYQKYAKELIEKEAAYYAFDTTEEIELKRKEAEQEGITFTYDQEMRKHMRNSLTMSIDEVKNNIKRGIPYVIRFKTPENTTINVKDIIRGNIEFKTDTLDDKVLFKSDGLPTYHLANIIDDHLMKITHIIRGEEWLPSLPLHVLLYKAFCWDKEMPQFAHLPLLLKPTGKGKLSKRDGEKMGFPVFPLEWKSENGISSSGYKEEGYFPEAFVNIISLLGWNPGTNQEILSMNDLIEQFDLTKVQKAGARFNPEKAKWFNHQYILNKSNKSLAKDFMIILKNKNIIENPERAEKIISLIKERTQFQYEIWDQAKIFYQAPKSYDKKVVKKRWKSDIPNAIKEIYKLFKDQQEWDSDSLKKCVSQHITYNKLSFGNVMNALRLCMVGGAIGPDLFTIIQIVGRNETLDRISKALNELSIKDA